MKRYKLGEIADIVISNVDKKSRPNEKSIYLCNFTDVYRNWAIRKSSDNSYMKATANDNKINTLLLKKGFVAFTKDSETRDDIGISTYIADDFDDLILGYHCVLVKPYVNILDGEYLNAFLHSKFAKKFFELNATGSGMRFTLSSKCLMDIPVLLPDLSEQQRIAKILSTIDDKIELNKKINRELETMAKELYDYWFVQFDFPNAQGKPYKSSGGKMVWNETLKREIPEGWEVGNLYSIADFINGLACQKFRPKDGENALPVIKIKEMHDGITAKTEQVSENIPSKHKIFDGDILFSWSATLEIMYWYGGSGGLNQHIFKVNPKSYFPKEYVYEQLSSYIVNFIKMAEARKTTMGHITIDHLEQSKIPLPPESLIKQFKEKVYPIHLKIGQTKQENCELTKLRDWLLPMLMNGEVRVR